jgi:Fe-Mn family superoxide dismutase
MKPYTPKTFTIPTLTGISNQTIEEHLKLYQGYVKNANGILEKIGTLMTDPEGNAYTIGELQRRFSFEFNGMRNHELYFSQLENGSSGLPSGSQLKQHIEKQAPSFDAWLAGFKLLAMTRGIGWAILSWDPVAEQLTHGWVDEQHLGHLVGLTPILALDMWEHSYVADYQPSGKKQYVEDYFANLNWSVAEERFIQATQPK